MISTKLNPFVIPYFCFLTHYSHNELIWTTAEEVNFSHFELERSADAVNFEKIASIASKSLSVNSITNYQYDDFTAKNLNYYRLKSVDLDGKTAYSNVIEITSGKGDAGYRVYPNPFSGVIFMERKGNNQNVNYEILNANGQLVYKGAFQNSVTVPTNDFPAGITS